MRVLTASDVGWVPVSLQPGWPLSAVVPDLFGRIQAPAGSFLLPVVLGTEQWLVFHSSIPELPKVLRKAQLALHLTSSEHSSSPCFPPTGPNSEARMPWRGAPVEEDYRRGGTLWLTAALDNPPSP